DGLSWTRRPSGTVRPLEGPGPRATPTIANGGLFVTGATGMFLRLDPAPGAILGQQVLKSVAGRAVPMWGFAASPLVTGSVAIVYAGGPGDKALSAASAPLRRDTGIPQTFLRKRQHPATALHKQCNGDM